MSLRMEVLTFSSLSLCFISLNVLTGSFCLPQGFTMSLSCLTFNFSLHVSLNVSLLVQLFHHPSVMLLPPADPPWLSLCCSCCSPSILIVNMNFPSFLHQHLQLVAFSFSHYSTVPSISPLFWYCTSSLLDDPGIGSVWEGVPFYDTDTLCPSHWNLRSLILSFAVWM